MTRIAFAVLVAVGFLGLGSNAWALPSFKEVKDRVSENPDDVRSRYLLGKYYFKMKNYDDALREWKFIVAKSPKAWGVYNRIGVAYFRKGGTANMYQALKIWRFVGKKDPTDTFAKNAYAKVLPRYRAAKAKVPAPSGGGDQEGTGEAPAAQQPVAEGEAAPLTEKQAEGEFDAAFQQYCNEDYVQAMGKFERVATTNFKKKETLFYLASCYLKDAEKPEKAVETFQKYIEAFGEDARTLSGMGAAYGLQGQFDRQIECYEKSLQGDPNDPETHFQLALAYDKVDKPNKTVEHAQRAVQLDASFKKRLQPLIKNSKVARRIGSIITDVLKETESSQLSDEQIDEYARRVGEILGEENINPDSAGSRFSSRVKGMMKDPSKRKALQRFMGSSKTDQDIDRLADQTGVDRSEVEAAVDKLKNARRQRSY